MEVHGTVDRSRYYGICQVSDASKHIRALIVKSCHEKVLHGGMKDTLTKLRSRFWIVQGSKVVKKLLFHCVICRRFDSRPFQPPPPSLPGS